MTADQVCALHFSWDSTKRVAYQCQRGARWACCNEAEAGETTEQNLGTCTRVTDEEAADDEEGTGEGDTEDAKDPGSDDSEPPEVLKIE